MARGLKKKLDRFLKDTAHSLLSLDLSSFPRASFLGKNIAEWKIPYF